MLDSTAAVRTFYDIDTPITVAALRERGASDYLRADQLAGAGCVLQLYRRADAGGVAAPLWSAARGAAVLQLRSRALSQRIRASQRFACAMSYMGTYAPDRQPKLEEYLFGAARALPEMQFIVAGPQYPKGVQWPRNVRHIVHLNPRWHPHLYSSSRLTLNVTRRDMVMAGYSPSVRLFEAAACGAAIVSDNWPGLERFFEPGREILLPASCGGDSCAICARWMRGNCAPSAWRHRRECWRRTPASSAPLEFEREVEAARGRRESSRRETMVDSEAVG